MSDTVNSRLFTPVKLGSKQIHRVALPPLTRFRAEAGTHVPLEIAELQYEQRASPGTLIITEATYIAHEAGGYPEAPGIYSEAQIEAWKKINTKVHAKGSIIFLQLWALGRAARLGATEDPPIETVSASPIPLKGTTIVPRELTVEDIARYVGLYKQAALNAIRAGFDGVELHGAHGYLVDQFLQTVSNKRTDSYGGSVENRARFALEVVAAISQAIGEERTAVRLSPWATHHDMQEPNPIVSTFAYVVKELVQRFPNLGYLSFIEPRLSNGEDSFSTTNLEDGVRLSNDVLRAIVRGIDPETIPVDDSFVFPEPDASHPSLFMSSGAYTPELALLHSDRTGDVVGIGRLFLSTPDLIQRIHNHQELNAYDRATFYAGGARGYIDYPTWEEVQARKAAALVVEEEA